MITRRSLLISSSALALSSIFNGAAAQRSTQLVRYGVATPEGRKMLRIYAQGVNAMKALAPQDPRSWIFQWGVHATPQPKAKMLDTIFPDGSGEAFDLARETWSTCQSHQGQLVEYFLPWHRLYVMQFEEIIRVLTRRDDFTLPYWDYTSPGSYAIPEEFQSKSRNDPTLSGLFVPNRNRDGGPFRSADVNAGEPLNKYYRGRRNFLVLPNLREPSYSVFCSQIDSQLHNQVHRFIGDDTNMGNIPTAAGDPIFWLHHCNVDRMWTAWNASGGINPVSTSGTEWADTSFVFASSEGERVDINIGSISNPATLPYNYDTLPVGGPGPAIASTSAPMEEVLLKSINIGASAVSANPSQPAAAVALGWNPVKVALAPTASKNRLSALATSSQIPETAHLVLRLRDVRVQLDPNTAYQVFLDLPPNASDEAQDEHYVGLLVFFEMGAEAGHAMHAGRNIEFDVTDLVKRLGRTSALQNETSITIAPVGAPAAASMPTISGGIELMRK
jgi:tyrosinase